MANKITVILPDSPDVKAKIISRSVQGPRGPRGLPGENVELSKSFTYDSNGELVSFIEGDVLHTLDYNPDGSINTITTTDYVKTFVYDSNGEILEINVNDT